MTLEGLTKGVIVLELDGNESGLVIDETSGKVMVGMYSQVTGKGLGFEEIFVIDTNNGTAEEIPVDYFIPLSILDARGELQVLISP